MPLSLSTKLSGLARLAPSIQFPVTVCVICYGSHAQLARRFLDSLYRNTDPSLFYLRAGLNEAEPATHDLFRAYADRFHNIRLYTEPKNIFKNPLMRRLFHEKPMESNWTIWCDDDTHFTRPDWLQRLALRIEQSPQADMWGWIHVLWTRDEGTLEWIRAASWFCSRPFRIGKDLEGNESAEFRFATGGFWALRTEQIYQLDWPDPRLRQGAEDFILGEALRQRGCRIENFNHGVAINDADRRNAASLEHSHILR
jgi:GT2 family glycosyltransferase